MFLHGFCELLICACTPDRVRCVTSISGVPVWVVEAWCPCKSSVVIIFYSISCTVSLQVSYFYLYLVVELVNYL